MCEGKEQRQMVGGCSLFYTRSRCWAQINHAYTRARAALRGLVSRLQGTNSQMRVSPKGAFDAVNIALALFCDKGEKSTISVNFSASPEPTVSAPP